MPKKSLKKAFVEYCLKEKFEKNREQIKILDTLYSFHQKKKFLLDYKNTHKVNVLYSFLYSKPNNKNKINKKLSFGSRIKILEETRGFYRFNNYWIKKKNLQKVSYVNNNIFYNIKKFINVKYKWGGKNYKGIDCSGLVQLFINYNNKFCPRDTKDQIKYFKKRVMLKNIKKNDLIFWKGHVAIALSKNKVIHAYGPFKKVVVMSLKGTINRIKKTANLKVIGLRRIV